MLNLPEEILKQDKSDVGIISLRTDNVITFEPHKGISTHTLDAMKYELDIFKNWADENKLGFLADNRALKKLDADIRVYAQKNLPLFCDKFALIVASGISSFITNTAISFSRPDIPIKAFTDKETALNWLKS